MKALIHSTQFETMFDWRGITSLSSGTAPHNPAENRIVVQNSEWVKGPTNADDEACSAAAAKSLFTIKSGSAKIILGRTNARRRA